MKRLRCFSGLAVLLIVLPSLSRAAVGHFDQKLPPDKQVIHILNRLTFGPRPGDAERVRKLTLEKWIDLQLHPDRIAENPVLEAKLKPLGTLQLATWQLLEKYPPIGILIKAPVLPPLPAPQLAKLMNCSAEERRTMLAAFDSETRGQIFAAAPPQLLDGLPDDLKQEARKVRQAEEQSRQKELRRLMPPLNELLSPEQIQTINHGTPPEKVALINSFDPEKRLQILHAVALQPLMDETRNQ